jgi:nucleoside recognition membrane protein YjiH
MLAFGAFTGGIIAAVFGVTEAFVLDGLTFFLSAWLISRIAASIKDDRVAPEPGGGWLEFLDGLRYLRGEPFILGISLVVATLAGIEHLFIPWYGVVIFACLLTALITPRLPPLSRKAETYKTTSAIAPESNSVSGPLLAEAWRAALQRAAKSPDVREFFSNGASNLAFFLFSVITAATALATAATLIVFHTDVFSWLGYPFIAVFELAQLPDATAAATAVFSGFLDQYMPAVAASGIVSAKTSFVLAGLSVCQLIYMSEVGVIILRSSLPITLMDLVAIFLLRTAIVLPVLVAGAHLVAG